MSKKKKIIIVAVCMGIIILGTIVGIIIATRKKFDITPNTISTYNNHTKMDVVSVPQGYTDNTTFSSNATIIIQKNDTGKYGVYSYFSNKIIIPANYSNGNITAVSIKTANDIDTNEDIFRAIGDNGEIDYYNDEGVRLNITEFNSEESQNYGFIKEKNVEVFAKKKGIKIKTSDNFEDKKIAITNAEFITAYIQDNLYHYETWKVTDKDGNEYTNLYKVSNGERILIQTLNNYIGGNIENALTGINITNVPTLQNLTPLYFLTDGTPMLAQFSISQVNPDQSGIVQIKVYDIYFNEVKSANIEISDDFSTSFRVGNNIYFQYKILSNEKNFDFCETTYNYYSSETNYYQLKTYRFSLKYGTFNEVDFDYLVDKDNIAPNFNVETTLLYVNKIENKIIGDRTNILINDKLQIKEIDYMISSIHKITDDRYIVDCGYTLGEKNNGLYLIDNKYNKICYLGEFDYYFTTNESVMLSDNESGYTYVCDLQGTVIKRYFNKDITNINDDKYYMVSTEKEVDGITYEEKYLERLGLRESTPLYSVEKGNEEYIYNGETYVAYDDTVLYNKNCIVSIFTRVKKVDNTYTYEFYNAKGKLLRSIPNFETSDCKLIYYDYNDNDHILVYISTNKGGVGYTMILDR